MARKEKLEVCSQDIESVIAASQAGADRVELCSGLEIGGVTPSIGLIRKAVEIMGKKVFVLIRPRGGDFVYSPEEVDIMEADVMACEAAGVGGVVIGALLPDGSIDTATCRRLKLAAGNMSVTFHRAFDRSADFEKNIETLVEMGIDRILTSGLAPDVMEGALTLRRLNQLSNGRIIILAGGGVTPENIRELLDKTGCVEAHASAKFIVENKCIPAHGDKTLLPHDIAHEKRSTSSVSLINEIINQLV